MANVDAYQGRENAIVILSLVRSNDSKVIGFMNVSNRLNVAISRARNFLIIVGNIEMYRRYDSQIWRRFVREVDENAVIIPDGKLE